MAVNNANYNPEVENEKKQEITLDYAQKEFIESKLKTNPGFFDSYNHSNLFDDFSSYLKSSSKFKEFSLQFADSTSDKKDIIKNQLKSEISKITVPRKINKGKLYTNILKEYELTSDQQKDLDLEINKLGNGSLSNLLKYSSKRNDFLVDNNVFSDKKKAFENKKSNLKSIENKLDINLGKLNQEDREKILEIFDSSFEIGIEDIKFILPFLKNKDSKLNLLNHFLDYISYKDLEDNNLLSDELKNNIFSDFKKKAEKSLDGFTEEDIKNSFDSIDKNEYLLDVNNLSGDFIKLLDDDKVLQKIVDSYNSDLKIDNESKDSIVTKLKPEGDNGDIHESFLELISENNDISKDIKDSISNFKEGNFIELKTRNEVGEEATTYYYIEKVDSGTTKETKNVILKDVTSSQGGYRKDLSGSNHVYGYNGIYNLLKGISAPENKDRTIKFSTKDELKDKEIADDTSIENITELKNKLDLIDPEGRDIDFSSDKMVIELGGDDNFVFLIDSIKGNNIIIDQGGHGKIKVDFNDFYSIFSNGDFKRKNKTNNFGELRTHLSNLGISEFDGLELGGKNKDKLILSEDKGEMSEGKDYTGVKLFVAGSGEAVYINEISENEIVYTMGKYDDKKKTFKKSSDSYSSKNMSQFVSDMAKYKFEAITDNVKGDKKTEAELDGEKALKGSFLSKFMTKMSFAEIFEGLKFLPDTIQKNLERGNKLKSYKFAESIAGLGGKNNSFYLSMKTAKEQEEKNLIEEMTNNLKALGSADIIAEVGRILLNQDSSEEELLSALMTIVSKYGVLYPKGLKKHKGSFSWYNRLGGTEAFKRKVESEMKESKSPDGRPQPVFFTEERLVERWLGERAKGNAGKSLRSKFDKDYGNALASGMKDEMEDGEMKAGNQATTAGRVDYFVNQLKSMEYANATGSIEKVFGKNGSAVEMQAVPFVLTMSGLARNFDQVLLNKLIGISFSSPFTGLFFNKDNEGIDLYKNFIEEVIKDKYGEKSEIYSDYKGINNDLGSTDGVNGLYEFWKKHGKNLVNHINLSDPYTILKKDENPVYKNYYEAMKGVHSDGEFDVKGENIVHGMYDKNPVAYTGGLLGFITSDTVGSLGREENKKAYEMYIESMKKFRDYNKSDLGISDSSLRDTFEQIFWPFAEKIAEKSGKFKDGNSPFVNLFKRELGIPIYDEIKHGGKKGYLDSVFDDFMNYKKIGSGLTQDEVKTQINDIVDPEGNLIPQVNNKNINNKKDIEEDDDE